MKLKNLAALSMAAVLCVMTAGCGADNGKDSAKKDSTGEEPKQTSQAEQDSDELVINYVSARGETDAADVRLDPSTNEVYRKELANLGMGESTPEEFCKRMDEAVAQYAPDYFDVE
ncbi:hypothetical protein [Blautia sp.]|uniref:hypothetical protein n=1 Tax=Blautia sp. TaxID=1955243 RepID=UPI0025889804|nr:hypothetical protein [Blautia sp.]